MKSKQQQSYVDLIERKDGLCYKKYTRGGPFTGNRKRFYSKGKLWLEENWKKGKLHGPYENYLNSGRNHRLYVKGNYKNGKEDGLWENYHDNGQLFFKVNYKNGKVEDGPFEEFHENGQLRYTQNYKNGEIDGFQEENYENEDGYEDSDEEFDEE